MPICQGLKFRIGGSVAGRCCRGLASCRSSSPVATSIRRWRKARSTRPNGSVPTTTRSSASTRSRRTTTTRAGGKAVAMHRTAMVNLDKWNALPKHYQAVQIAAPAATHWCGCAKYDAVNPPALKKLVCRRHAAAAVLAGRSWRPRYKAAIDTLRRDFRRRTPTSRRSTSADLTFRGDQYLWWQVAEFGFDSFMIRARRLTADQVERRRKRTSPGASSGALCLAGSRRYFDGPRSSFGGPKIERRQVRSAASRS